jgi:ABC-2 type transport system permease protein
VKSTLATYLRFEVRANLRATISWTIGLSIYVGAVVSLYPSVRSALNIGAIPPGLREAFNITDFTYLAGFLSSELFGVILPLVLPFYGIVVLSNVVAGNEERGRLDVLLGNPIPRWQLVAGTWIVVAVYLLAMVMVFGSVIWAVASALDLALSANEAYRATFALWPPALAFSTLALVVSTLARQRAIAIGVPGAVVLLSYLILVIGRLADPLSFVRYISAYHYYGFAILEGVWWGGVAVLLAATAALLALAIITFNRRDIYA